MRNHILSLLLTGTVLSCAAPALADIAISDSLGPGEYTESYYKFQNGSEIPADNFAEADIVYLSATGTGEEHDGGNIIHVNQNTEGNSAFSVIFENSGYLETTSVPSEDFDGGGHKFAAGCVLKYNAEDCVRKLVEQIKKQGL